jgi:arylsulfatase A-like enzyme
MAALLFLRSAGEVSIRPIPLPCAFQENLVNLQIPFRFVAFLLVLVGESSLSGAERPNVLFIAVDDLRPELGCYGKSSIHSPNIDRLAATGVRFEHAYCQQAVCGATRNSLLSGLRPDTTGIYGNSKSFREVFPDLVALPQQFKNHGYTSIGMGKIYHQNDPLSWSEPLPPPDYMVWLRPENIETKKRREKEARERGLTGKQLGRAARGPAAEMADVPDNAYPEGQLTERALAKLNEFKNEPFFLAVGFVRPHLPFNCPKKYWDLYDRDEIELPEPQSPPKDAPSIALTNWSEMRSYAGIPKSGPVSDEQALELIHGYRACVSYVDAQIGRLLDELDRLKLADNTIVILWGDHGWKLGDWGMWCKHTNFELDTHVPMIVRAPGAPGNGQSCPALVEYVDIYPSLCELSGLPLPEHLEGKSFAPLLNDPDRPWKPAAFSQYPRGANMGYSMRTARYRFTLWVDQATREKTEAIELYDFQVDPRGSVNRASDPEYGETIGQLSAQLKSTWHAGGR